VQFIGKPFARVFHAVEAALGLPPDKILMVGDSLEHDIAGAANAGWHSAFICSGLHAEYFREGEIEANLAALADAMTMPLPCFALYTLR